MADSGLLKVWPSAGGPGELRWHRQPVLSVLRGIVSRGPLTVEQEYVRHCRPGEVSMTYSVTRGSFHVGTVYMTVGPHRMVVQAVSRHEMGRPAVEWKWYGRRPRKGTTPDGRKAIMAVVRPRLKFRRLGVRIRKALAGMDDGPCVRRVMES